MIGEYDASGNDIKTYGYKPNSTWTTDPVFMQQNGQYCFYHNDHLGTPMKMTSVSGAVVWSATYDAFGKATVDGNSTVANNLRFPGQYYDGEASLHYNWNRYYDPASGRYIIIDPIGLRGGINFFVYAKNSPARLFDSMGLDECTNTTVSVGGGFALGGAGLGGECGTGILQCTDECGNQTSYAYKYCCGGLTIGPKGLPKGSFDTSGEFGGWSGDVSRFRGSSIQIKGFVGSGLNGWSGTISWNPGVGGGVTTGPAGGIGASIGGMGCWTWDVTSIEF
jgi:RHS repeat-associated protein